MNTQNKNDIREFVDCAEMDFNGAGAGAREPEPDTAVIPIVLHKIKTATSTSSTIPVTMSQNNIAMVPVHQEDFKKFNEFAEAVWICRDLENADKIREMRKTLLKEVKHF